MNKISKLQIIGEGEQEIVYLDDMSYEQNGVTLKVYLTKPNQSKLLPLTITPLITQINEDVIVNEEDKKEEDNNGEQHTEN